MDTIEEGDRSQVQENDRQSCRCPASDVHCTPQCRYTLLSCMSIHITQVYPLKQYCPPTNAHQCRYTLHTFALVYPLLFGCTLKEHPKCNSEVSTFRSIGPPSDKLRQNQILAGLPHCNLQYSGGKFKGKESDRGERYIETIASLDQWTNAQWSRC